MTSSSAPLSVAVVNDHPVVVAGVAKMLEDDTRIRVVEIASHVLPEQTVDVVLMDSHAPLNGLAPTLEKLAQDPRFGRIAVFSWDVNSPQVEELLADGAISVLAKSLTPVELADALVRVGRGERVMEPAPPDEERNPLNDWPGRGAGLTARESEVVALITSGLTNEEIARNCYLSINSVKTYIRSAYRKMGVVRRSQAVAWGIENGMLPRALRRM
nr:response regulator transcription factor [Actinomycetales bacterium]